MERWQLKGQPSGFCPNISYETFGGWRERMKKILVCSIHHWNIRKARMLKGNGFKVTVFSHREQLTAAAVDRLCPDLILLPHWSWYIPAEIFENYECIVFHMTDLPYGRGGSPLQNLIVRGHISTKISAIKVVDELDAGPVYMKVPLSLKGSAEEVLKRASALIFDRMIPAILKRRIRLKPQIGSVVFFQRRIPSQSEIPKGVGIKKVFDHIRMLDAEGYPKAFIKVGASKMEFSKAKLKDGIVFAEVRIFQQNGVDDG
jgi:methionyl-tRNA formyltransferase